MHNQVKRRQNYRIHLFKQHNRLPMKYLCSNISPEELKHINGQRLCELISALLIATKIMQ
ncbi:unnamed protein product [Camellia sinensis]